MLWSTASPSSRSTTTSLPTSPPFWDAQCSPVVVPSSMRDNRSRILTAVSVGAGEVIGVDGVPDKLIAARELGATQTFSPTERQELAVKADVVIEAAGNARAFEAAVAATAPGGVTVTVGLPAPDARSSISPLGLVAEARTIIGSYLGSAVPSRDIPKYAQMWREGRLPVEKLISSRIGLDEINRGMDELADGNAIRQVITFD